MPSFQCSCEDDRVRSDPGLSGATLYLQLSVFV